MTDTSSTRALTPAQMSELTSVSIDTLRYYEREGLLRDIHRNEGGHRRYAENDVLWVKVLRCLRETGMTIDDLRHYCDLGEAGAASEPERYALLTEHRDKVRMQLEELERSLELIEEKMSMYLQHDPATAGKEH